MNPNPFDNDKDEKRRRWSERKMSSPELTPQSAEPAPPSPADHAIPVLVVGPNPLPVTMDLSQIFSDKKHPATTPRAERGEGGGSESTGAGIAKAIGGRFLAVLGPLYALSTVLSQTNSGMGVFGKAVNVLGATLAPILLPAFALLSAGILTVADLLWNEIAPALGDFYDLVFDSVIPAFKALVDVLMKVQEARDSVKDVTTGKEANDTSDAIRKQSGTAADIFDFARGTVGAGLAGKPPGLGSGNAPEPGSAAWFAAQNGEGGAGGAGGKGGMGGKFGELFKGNMNDVIKSLSMSMGPKGSYSAVSEVGKQAQLAALNADPIEMKAAQRVIESIQEFQRAWERRQGNRGQINRRGGEGDFRGGQGAGGDF